MSSKKDIKINNEQFLFQTKIHMNRNNLHIKPTILFRNDTLNSIINKSKSSQNESKKLTEEYCNYNNKNYKYYKNFNSINKSNILNLPTLSEKSMKINDLLNNRKKYTYNKKYDDITYNHNYNEEKRKKYIDNIMQSCCSVVKMNLFKKKINNNKECFICYNLKNHNINYKPIFLYKNNRNKTKNNFNKYKKIFPSDSVCRKTVKLLVNEETMTNFQNKKNNKVKTNNNDKEYDFLLSRKIFNKYYSKDRINNYIHFNTYNDFNML